MKSVLRSALSRLVNTVAVAVLLAAAPPAHSAPGDLDPLDANLVGTSVRATAVQPDGKTIIAGIFTSVLGVARSNIARLNADGTLDMGFNPKPNNFVFSVAVQADGKVLLGGGFSTLQPNGAAAPIPRSRIARVNADGTLDTSFDPNPNDYVSSVAVQADGKVLLGGAFFTLQPRGAGAATARKRIARVNADGSLDTGFDPNPNDWVSSVAVQADGKVLLGGLFTTLQPNGAAATTARSRIARVNTDGTLDTGFDPKANDYVTCVAVQADGKVLLGGAFNGLQPNGAASPISRPHIARVNADGTLDTGFDPKANNWVVSVAVQADGKVLLGGGFTAVNGVPRNYIARVNANGTLDTGFNPNPNSAVECVAVQADGKVLLGGTFFTLQPNGATVATPRNHFARILNDPATQTLTVPDATQVLWQRGGAAPELSRVTFELSTDGGASWTPLGAGTRIGTTANWQRTGLALPASGQLRARGVTSGGYGNGSSGLIEQVAAFTFIVNTPLESWRQTYFGSTANSGSGADNFDFDDDGPDNLTEFAFGLNPVQPASAPLPQWQRTGSGFTVNFTQPVGVGGITYGAEWCTFLSGVPADWTNIPDTGTAPQHQFSVPFGGLSRMFLRLKVTSP